MSIQKSKTIFITKIHSIRFWEWMHCHHKNSLHANGDSLASVDVLLKANLKVNLDQIHSHFIEKKNSSFIRHFAGDSKLVKKDGENTTSMETTPSEQPAAPATSEPTVAASGK